MVLLLALALLVQTPPACADVRTCRQQAMDAVTAGDFERFHDLAWRTVQKGRPNDPDLMYILARAQSLSGRPGDAIVMLDRLTEMGVATDAADNPDFERVRALKEWPDLQAKMAARGMNAGAPVAPATASPAPAPASSPAPRVSAEASEEALAFSAPPFEPVGLAYDGVSRRFIVGDRNAGRLVVIDELSHHVTTLVSAASAGFYDAITAFEIDPRRGDLWVASVKDSGPDSVLHKLQLVSGRVLEQIRIGAEDVKARIADLAVAGDGTILALDSEGGRILRLQPGTRRLDDVGRIAAPKGARSFALANERVVYVASDEGIARIDLQTKETTKVRVPREIDLSRVEKIRWHDGDLVLVERTAGGHQIERARLDASGQAITRSQLLPGVGSEDPRAVAVSGSVIYYLVGAKGESSIRRARLK